MVPADLEWNPVESSNVAAIAFEESEGAQHAAFYVATGGGGKGAFWVLFKAHKR
jgi:hypothetical protein